MAHFGPTRRSLLQGTLASTALGLTGFPARAAEPQWKKYAGTTIEANLIKGPRGELLQKYAAEFTDLTGIKVESEVIPDKEMARRMRDNMVAALKRSGGRIYGPGGAAELLGIRPSTLTTRIKKLGLK